MTPVFVPTRDRPQELRGCLDALTRHLVHAQLDAELIVLDDSETVSAVEQNTAFVAESAAANASQLGLSLRSIGAPERQALANTICAALSPHAPPSKHPKVVQAVDFALGLEKNLRSQLGRYGANRNAGLLLSAGTCYISIDNDIRAEFSRLHPMCGSPRPEQAARTGKGAGRTAATQEAFFMAPLPTASSAAKLCRPDTTHTLATLLQIVASPAARAIVPVHLALSGVCGNRWYPRASVGYWAHGTPRDHSFCTRAEYRAALRSGYALLQVPELQRATNTFFATYCYAANAQSLLPPFPPLGRSEDLSFAFLVRYLYPNNAIAHLPCMVQHDLGPPRPFTDEDFDKVGVDFGTLTRLVINHLLRTTIPPGSPSGLALLGRRLQLLSKQKPRDWQAFTHGLYLRYSGELIQQLEQLLELHERRPAYWAQDVEEYIALLRENAVASPQTVPPAVPQEFAGVLSPDEAATEHCRFLRSYGELLEHWPAIWDAAVQLNARESRLPGAKV